MNEGIEKNALSQPEIHAALDEIYNLASDIQNAGFEVREASHRLGRDHEPEPDEARDEAKLSENVMGRLAHLRQYLNTIRRDVQATAGAMNRLV